MLKLFISSFLFLLPDIALAQSAPATASSGFMSFIPLILIFIIFYFLLIRPQQKKYKEHQQMVDNLKIGNQVCLMSGIFGKIKDIDDKEKIASLEIADGVVIKVLKASVNQVLDSEKMSKLENNSKSNSSTKKNKSKE